MLGNLALTAETNKGFDMPTAMKCIREFLLDESGPTAVEYAVMLTLIVVTCLAAITTMGENLDHTYDEIINAQIEAAKAGS